MPTGSLLASRAADFGSTLPQVSIGSVDRTAPGCCDPLPWQTSSSATPKPLKGVSVDPCVANPMSPHRDELAPAAVPGWRSSTAASVVGLHRIRGRSAIVEITGGMLRAARMEEDRESFKHVMLRFFT